MAAADRGGATRFPSECARSRTKSCAAVCPLPTSRWSAAGYGPVRGSGYDIASGTSEATAYVTGVAALLKAQDPNRDWRAIKNLILAGGDEDPALRNILVNTITGKRSNAYGSLTRQNSTVLSRFSPKGDGSLPVSVPMGTTVGLAVLNINCAAANGPVQVISSARQLRHTPGG
jgi:subtilisin family serine protease